MIVAAFEAFAQYLLVVLGRLLTLMFIFRFLYLNEFSTNSSNCLLMTSMHGGFIRHPSYGQNLASRFQTCSNQRSDLIAPPLAPPGLPSPSASARSPLPVCPPPLPPLPFALLRFPLGKTPIHPHLLQPPPPQSLLASLHSASSARNCGDHSCGLGVRRRYV